LRQVSFPTLNTLDDAIRALKEIENASRISEQGAWTAYTATVTASSGTLAAYSATASVLNAGPLRQVRAVISLTDIGDAIGNLFVTLPTAAASDMAVAGCGMDTGASGKALAVRAAAGDNKVVIHGADGFSIIATGAVIEFFISYRAADS
jgi:hypothetical protein